MHQDISQILKTFPVSDSTAKQRIEEMAVNVKKNFQVFSKTLHFPCNLASLPLQIIMLY